MDRWASGLCRNLGKVVQLILPGVRISFYPPDMHYDVGFILANKVVGRHWFDSNMHDVLEYN